MALRDKIKEIDDIAKERIRISQWDADVEIRAMTGAERSRIFNKMDKDEDKARAYLQMIVSCTFDPETGEKIFAPEDIEWLDKKSGAALEVITAGLVRLNGFGKEVLENIEKN